MNEIIKILMDRDGLTCEEAREIYEETREEIYEALENGDCDVDDILSTNLCLEPDYIFCFI